MRQKFDSEEGKEAERNISKGIKETKFDRISQENAKNQRRWNNLKNIRSFTAFKDVLEGVLEAEEGVVLVADPAREDHVARGEVEVDRAVAVDWTRHYINYIKYFYYCFEIKGIREK